MLISHLVKFLHRMFENSENEKLVNKLRNFYNAIWSVTFVKILTQMNV